MTVNIVQRIKMKRLVFLWLMCFLFPGLLLAQEEVTKPRPHLVKRLLNLIVTMAIRIIDSTYMEFPDRRWAFVLRCNLSQAFFDRHS